MLDSILNWLNSFLDWIVDLFKQFIDFFTDLPVLILDSILSAIYNVLAAIPIPEFLQTPLSSYLSNDILYFLNLFGFSNASALLVSAIVLRFIWNIFRL